MKKYFKNRHNKIKKIYFKKNNVFKKVVFPIRNVLFFRKNKYFLYKRFFKKLTKKRFLKTYVFLKVNFKMFKKSKNSRMGKGKGSFFRWNIVLSKNNKIVFMKKISFFKFLKKKHIS